MSQSSGSRAVVLPGKLPVQITASCQYSLYQSPAAPHSRKNGKEQKDLLGSKSDIQNIKIKTKWKETQLHVFRKLDKNSILCFWDTGSTEGWKDISSSLYTLW